MKPGNILWDGGEIVDSAHFNVRVRVRASNALALRLEKKQVLSAVRRGGTE